MDLALEGVPCAELAAAVRELCRTSEVLQETYANLHRCEETTRRLDEIISRLNASNQELRAQIESNEQDLFVARGERDVLRLLMTSSLTGCLPAVKEELSAPQKEQATTHQAAGATEGGQDSGDEYVP